MTAATSPISRQGAARIGDALLLGAPLAALLAGISAEWLDFRALRYPLLLLVGVGVMATASTAFGAMGGWKAAWLTVALGVATWAAAETIYVLLHVAQGERFDAPRFGAQPLQALGLIGVHALFLGVPTGVVVATILAVARRMRGT